MSVLNPYQSPQNPKPLDPAQIVRRGVGVAAILLLTPLAVIVATFIGRGAAIVAQVAAEPIVGPDNPYLIFPLWFGPPLVVLIAMLWWALRVHRRNQEPEKLTQ
jgi:hypothetical protein